MFVCTGDGTIRTFKEEGVAGSVPVKDKDFTYTGNCEVIDDSNEVSGTNWRIKFLTSGIFTISNGWDLIDLWLLSGGLPGSAGGDPSGYIGGAVGGTGGNGGTGATHKEISIEKQTSYQIIIGGSAGSTSAFNESIAATGGGGQGAHADAVSISGANGNPGGSGILEFGEAGSDLYAGGGGSGATSSISKLFGGAGGANGGGKGGNSAYRTSGSGSNGVWDAAQNGSSGTANTGGGGGGGGGGGRGHTTYTSGSGGAGGSGIVIIRKHKE